MPDVFALQTSEDKNNRDKLSTIVDKDRYTPMPNENSYGQKPEIYYIGSKNDEPPLKLSSPRINKFYPLSNGGPELYHLKVTHNDHDIHDRRPAPAFATNNRISPAPDQNSSGQGPEMYYIQTNDGNHRQSPHINNNHQEPKFDHNNITHFDDPNQQKITMYLLTTTSGENRENLPPSYVERTPSPLIRPPKKQQPISYDIVDDNNKYDIPNKRRPFPTALHDVPTNIRYVPSAQSKASASIQRSMNKYRFGGN